MSDETRKANRRRAADPFFSRIFRGRGIDIGAGSDNLDRDRLFTAIESCEDFDRQHGDAQEIQHVRTAGAYDFVYSSHCLEHMHDPVAALKAWFELVRPGGYLVVVVPDEDLYEQGGWPSRFNGDHKWTFTVHKPHSWSPRSVNIVHLIAEHLRDFSFVRIEVPDGNYPHGFRHIDHTLGDVEAHIEVVIRKNEPWMAHPFGYLDLDALLRSGSLPYGRENLAHRLPSLRLCADLLLRSNGGYFVETGCQSTLLLHSQGLSTSIFAEIARRTGARLSTVDLSADALRRCRTFTCAYQNIDYVQMDSVAFLEQCAEPIHFLVLDSFDFFSDVKEQSRRHQLREIEAAFPKLSDGAIVLLDDANVQMWFADSLSDEDRQGKTLYTHRFLLDQGAECLIDYPSYQRLYRVRK